MHNIEMGLNEGTSVEDTSSQPATSSRRAPYLLISVAAIAIWVAFDAIVFYVCADGVEDKGALWVILMMASPVSQILQPSPSLTA